MFSTSSFPSYPPHDAVDASPLLTHSLSDHPLRRPTPPLQSAARYFRIASGRRMMLREPSLRVRENAAEQLEARQIQWAFSKTVVILDVVWHMAFVAIGVVVLGMSMEEKPTVPLRAWVCCYLFEALFHCVCVIVKYRRRVEARAGSALLEQQNESGTGQSGGTDVEDSGIGRLQQEGDGYRKRIESVNTMLAFIWWLLGFYWVTTGGHNLAHHSPKLYWLCITYLALDIVIVFICVLVACLVGIAVCCCLPVILALLSAVTDQEGASKEEINQLPKYRFERVDGDVKDSYKGIMTECDTDTPAQHLISMEDAECCICLSSYEDGAELRELPCNHHFHIHCIDKWLHINATCPLCKFNLLSANHPQQV